MRAQRPLLPARRSIATFEARVSSSCDCQESATVPPERFALSPLGACGSTGHAHANEYRFILREPRELGSLLGRLREAIIKHYGQHTRAVIQLLEAKQLEMAGNAPPPEVADTIGHPILVGGAEFWRKRRKGFHDHDVGQNRSLAADWDSLVENWHFRGSQEAQAVFKPLAAIRGKGVSNL
jgi:hypothetical protein